MSGLKEHQVQVIDAMLVAKLREAIDNVEALGGVVAHADRLAVGEAAPR